MISLYSPEIKRELRAKKGIEKPDRLGKRQKPPLKCKYARKAVMGFRAYFRVSL